MKIRELYEKMSEYFPRELSCEWDNDGLMCSPDTNAECKSVLLTLDVTERAVAYAREIGCDLIISHHPLIFRPLSCVTDENFISRKVIRLLSEGISVFSFHTRADFASGGVNDALASALSLADVTSFGEGTETGRIGVFCPECSLDEFALHVKSALGAPTVSFVGEGQVCRVAVLGGSGGDFLSLAQKAGADTFVTGELGYNSHIDAKEKGINVIAAGHFYTERPVLDVYEKIIAECCPDIVVHRYEECEIKQL